MSDEPKISPWCIDVRVRLDMMSTAITSWLVGIVIGAAACWWGGGL